MSQITVKQHFVPQFYLRQWADQNDQLVWHNLFHEKARRAGIKSKLQQQFYYEDDSADPDNRVESHLSAMEADCAPTFQKLFHLARNFRSQPGQRMALFRLRSQVGATDLERIKRFAAFQYLRVPGAIETKQRELANTRLTAAQKAELLRPGVFTETGFSYIHRRFQTLKLSIALSIDQEFVTSDWPCFDMREDKYEPILGEEIGRNPGVALHFPLNPLMLASFVHPSFSEAAARAPDLIVNVAGNAEVRNSNGITVEKADNLVAASAESPFVFVLARKRSKVRKPSPLG